MGKLIYKSYYFYRNNFHELLRFYPEELHIKNYQLHVFSIVVDEENKHYDYEVTSLTCRICWCSVSPEYSIRHLRDSHKLEV